MSTNQWWQAPISKIGEAALQALRDIDGLAGFEAAIAAIRSRDEEYGRIQPRHAEDPAGWTAIHAEWDARWEAAIREALEPYRDLAAELNNPPWHPWDANHVGFGSVVTAVKVAVKDIDYHTRCTPADVCPADRCAEYAARQALLELGKGDGANKRFRARFAA